MPVSVNIQLVHPRKLAAVRHEIPPDAVSAARGPAAGPPKKGGRQPT